MESQRSPLTILLALTVAATAAYGAYLAADWEDGSKERVASLAGSTSIPTGEVLAARRDIPAATTLTAEMLEIRQVPLQTRSPRALTDMEQAVGMLTTAPLIAGEQVLDSHLAEQPAPDPTVADEIPAGPRTVWLAFGEFQGSGVSGFATLHADGGTTHVSLQLTGEGVVGDHPTHIHPGTCDNLAPNPIYPLTTVLLDEVDAEGRSETAVDDTSLDALQADDHVILVHQSRDELTDHLVCGEIKRSTAMAPNPETATAPNPGTAMVPNAGTGSSLDWAEGMTERSLVLTALAALAASFAVVTIVFPRRRARR